MRQPDSISSSPGNELPLRALPDSVLELCARLEDQGLCSLSHGEDLLDHLRAENDRLGGSPPAFVRTRSILCAATPEALSRALPRAVVTSEDGVRWTQGTASGPIDIITCGTRSLDQTLCAFGLGPLSFGFRPADGSWHDPAAQLPAFRSGKLTLVGTGDDAIAEHGAAANPFEAAPRRYWITARLIAEHSLTPSDAVLEAATSAFDGLRDRLPQAAPARREMRRILDCEDPGPALRFLRESGVGPFLVPGTRPENEDRIQFLPMLPAVRWAAWLRGSATASAMVRLRVPHALARRVERLQATHPIDRTVDSGREGGLRRILSRLSPEELEALFVWRRLDLTNNPNESERLEGERRLSELEDRIAKIRTTASNLQEVRALEIDGAAVMELLGAGPGRHVGQALAHLARHVAEDPERNLRERLETELLAWARENTNLLD